jgi:hypothetical protein
VDASPSARQYQTGKLCPFISAATAVITPCWKQNRTGVCTISSNSNGPRQDWLACPYRALDMPLTLFRSGINLAFNLPVTDEVLLRPINALSNPVVRSEVQDAFQSGRKVFVFSQTRLGGEVKVSATANSPAVQIDATIAELHANPIEGFQLGRFMMFEAQTADFHGSPKHVLALLERAVAKDPNIYHTAVERHPEWAATKVQGPNKANVFKRTYYQTVYKIQLARDPAACAGFVLAVPESVWDSWMPHLGSPELVDEGRTERLRSPGENSELMAADTAWILVFDIDREAKESPQPIRVVRRIVTTSAALVHYALDAAPRNAAESGVHKRINAALTRRVREQWTAPASIWPEPSGDVEVS